jgi:uncharacterized protein (DUF362 family)
MNGLRMTRRQFVARGAAAGVGLLALGKAFPQAGVSNGKSVVVRVRRPSIFATGEVSQAAVTDMVNAAVTRLAGEDDPVAAWRKFVSPDDVVGLKVNCLFGPGASTHIEVVNAVLQGCQAADVPAHQIIVWDRATNDLTKSGYPSNRDNPGVKFYGTDGDYEPERTVFGSFNGRLSRILTHHITALINLPILKSHNIAGITASMKNHYGSFDNPGDHHGNYCDPYIADVNAVPVIRDKTRLIIMDALFPIADGGPRARPQATWPYGAILAAIDPVAIDCTGLQIIEERRQTMGLQPIGTAARHIATAAEKGLGTNDPAAIQLIDLE